MKRIGKSVLLAGLLAMTLGACRTTSMPGDTASTSGMTGETDTTQSTTDSATAGNSGASGTTDSSGQATSGTMGTTDATGATGGTGATGSTASGTAGMQGSMQSGTMASAPNSTVTNIEIVPRQSAGSATGAGTVAGAAVGGSTTGATTSDRVYRITLRMDDGTVRTITQESTPAFATGDRVHMADGAIVR